jgi:hypothetical protein
VRVSSGRSRDSTSLEGFKAVEIRESLLSSDPIAMCELLVGLGEVTVLDVTDVEEGLRVTVETRGVRPMCPGCEVPAVVKDAGPIEWLTQRPQKRRDRVEWATLDLSGPYRGVFETRSTW